MCKGQCYIGEVLEGARCMKVFSVLQVFGLSVLLAGAASADDARWRDCRTCHAVIAPDGTELARGGRSGPNLYGISNRPLAGDAEFRFYSNDLRSAGNSGARWTAENFVAYLTDPDAFLRDVTGNPNAESGMHIQLRSGAREMYDYLRSLSD